MTESKKWVNELNRRVSKEVQMDNKYMKKWLVSLAIRKMEIKLFWDSVLPLHPEHKRTRNPGMQGKEPSCIAGGNVN